MTTRMPSWQISRQAQSVRTRAVHVRCIPSYRPNSPRACRAAHEDRHVPQGHQRCSSRKSLSLASNSSVALSRLHSQIVATVHPNSSKHLR